MISDEEVRQSKKRFDAIIERMDENFRKMEIILGLPNSDKIFKS